MSCSSGDNNIPCQNKGEENRHPRFGISPTLKKEIKEDQ